MNKNTTTTTMAAAIAVAGILTLAVLSIAIQREAFALQGSSNPCCDDPKKKEEIKVAVGGNGGSGGAGGAGGEGGQGGVNVSKENQKAHVDQDANGGNANGGHGGNANGGNAEA
jgi:hypothetical protein